jgi:hypothetical protein
VRLSVVRGRTRFLANSAFAVVYLTTNCKRVQSKVVTDRGDRWVGSGGVSSVIWVSTTYHTMRDDWAMPVITNGPGVRLPDHPPSSLLGGGLHTGCQGAKPPYVSLS